MRLPIPSCTNVTLTHPALKKICRYYPLKVGSIDTITRRLLAKNYKERLKEFDKLEKCKNQWR